jgi:two-component system, OmpR family, sensor kinase
MKIRHKITLWITGTGVLVSLVFSLIIFLEMKELPYKSIDTGLEVIGQILGRLAIAGKIPSSGRLAGSFSVDVNQYWIKIYDSHMKIIYQTQLARHVTLPMRNNRRAYTVIKSMPENGTGLGEEGNKVAFRVRTVYLQKQGSGYIIQIAKPLGQLQDEVTDLLQSIALGLLVTTLLLIFLGYGVAGRILKPIGVINRMARDISNRTLDRRIPMGKSRDELYELSGSLNRMFDRLQYSFDMQKQFIADASHELKSPITLLMLFMEGAIHRKDLPDSFQQRLIHQTNILRRMSRLVKNLLDLSALELKRTISFAQISLPGLLKSVLEDYADVFAAKRINLTLNIPEDLEVRGDKEELQRVFINLVDNAIKYSHTDGDIRIRAARVGHDIRVSLYNTGRGIPKADLERVFDQFYRVEKSRSLQYGGSGLGLTIVKRIVELHGGTVEMESEPGAWTQITITLPVPAESYQKQ